jgi:hypothetical protein
MPSEDRSVWSVERVSKKDFAAPVDEEASAQRTFLSARQAMSMSSGENAFSDHSPIIATFDTDSRA